jgi:hypothetical protein
MGTKCAVLAMICLGFIVCTAALAEEQIVDQTIKEKQRQIRSYIDSRAREIERFYDSRAHEIQSRAQIEINRLAVAETTGVVILREWAALQAAGTVLEINGFSAGHTGYYKSPYVRPPHRIELAKNQVERLIVARTKIADAISRAQARLEWELARLERQKVYALNVELPQLEQRLSDNLSEPPVGVVTGILYSRDKPTAIVGGAVVHPSQQINGVKIVGIYPDKVEFEQAGRRWQQKVRENPAPQWQ